MPGADAPGAASITTFDTHHQERREAAWQSLDMRYLEFAPSRPLRPFVHCLWTLSTGPSGLEPVLPDGRAEVVIHRGQPFQQLDADGVLREQARVVVAGQLTRPAVVGPVEDGEVLGIRFRTAGARAVLRLPLHEISDRLLPLQAVHPALARSLTEAVDRGPALQAVTRCLERWLCSAKVVRPHAISAPAVALLGAGRPVWGVARELGCSERTLERHLRADVGVSPKTLQRIIRFRRFFALVQGGESGSIASVRAGYYDQSHANRDFKAFAGSSAKRYFEGDSTLGGVFLGELGEEGA